MSSPAVVPRRSRRIIEREATFSRFLELPKELQIQIWQEVITDSIDKTPHKYKKFGTDLGYTILLTNIVPNGRIYFRGKKTNLWGPPFLGVYDACRFSRLVACQWWKGVLERCTTNIKVWTLEKHGIMEDLVEIIEDLRRKLDG